MSALLFLLLPVLLDGTRVLAVRTETVEGRPAVRVVALGELVGVSVEREGEELLVGLDADAPALVPPSPLGPIESVGFERSPGHLTVRVRVAADVPYEVRREGTLLAVLFGEATQPAEPTDVALLYRQLFPPAPAPPELPTAAVPAEGAASEEGGDGLHFGPFRLRPGVAVSYVNAQTTVGDSPEATPDSYWQIQPRLGLEATVGLPLLGGRIWGGYQPSFRQRSSFDIVREPTHTFTGGTTFQLGPSITLRATERYVTGVLDTNEVDPGQEYFFDLGRFRRNAFEAGLRVVGGGRLDLDLRAREDSVQFSQRSGFFDYKTQTLAAGLGYEAAPTLRAELAYTFDHIPEPELRPVARADAHGLRFTLDGEISPLLKGNVFVGYVRRNAPNAPEAGRRFGGVVAGASLVREFSRGSHVRLSGERSTYVSAFETNAFYVSNALQADLSIPLPLYLTGSVGGGFRVNRYRIDAAGLGEPRRESITGWSVGLGRSLTRRAYLRVDYRWQRRASNIDAFDVTTHSFLAQIGIRLFEDGS